MSLKRKQFLDPVGSPPAKIQASPRAKFKQPAIKTEIESPQKILDLLQDRSSPSIKKSIKTEENKDDVKALNKTRELQLKPEGPPEEEYGDPDVEPVFWLKDYYPKEMKNSRCKDYIDGKIPKPITELRRMLESTASQRQAIPVGDAVVHYFKRDLRTIDNRALSAAAKLAASKGAVLICMFLVSPQDYQAHFTSAARVDFDLRCLAVLRETLAEKDIPLYTETIHDRKQAIPHILNLCQKWNAKHLFCNMEYEVDELRRETKLIKAGLERGIAIEVLHDDVIVPPGILSTGQGKQYSVYSPWFRAWCVRVNSHPELLDESPAPPLNPPQARQNHAELFDMEIPKAPENKALSAEDKARFEKLWPVGEREALARLDTFLEGRVSKYKDARNFPAQETTAKLSVHFSAGTLAARTAVRKARDLSGTTKVDAGNEGIKGWISEVAWRDFYKHVMAWWPFVCMYKPFKYEMSSLVWPFNPAYWKAWTTGTTGFPIVDAAMRQMREVAWMHNRCRMIVASFLAKDLLLDWRHGERWFMEHLIDGDFASNNGGWGFSASTGVDPQPYFRIFNPLLQSEKFDADGEYIRKWIPELRNIKGKAIHDPYGRGMAKEAERAGYPRPCVVHSEMRAKALELYKSLS